MSRLVKGDLLGQVAFGRNSLAPMVDISKGGGYFGFTPDLRSWLDQQADVRKDLCCIVLELPKIFSLFPESEKWNECVKALFEQHAKTIEGYNAGLTVETEEHDVGRAGEKHQEVTKVSRARSEPSFGFVEKYGMPIKNLLSFWIRMGLQDPDTGYAGVVALGADAPTDLQADWYSATILVFEPDPSFRKIKKAWITTNLFPLETGDIIGKKDTSAAGEIDNMTIKFAGISQYNYGTFLVAQKIIDAISMQNADPFMREAFITDISSDVVAAQTGFAFGISELEDQQQSAG